VVVVALPTLLYGNVSQTIKARDKQNTINREEIKEVVERWNEYVKLEQV
jgi:hypothetical protein